MSRLRQLETHLSFLICWTGMLAVLSGLWCGSNKTVWDNSVQTMSFCYYLAPRHFPELDNRSFRKQRILSPGCSCDAAFPPDPHASYPLTSGHHPERPKEVCSPCHRAVHCEATHQAEVPLGFPKQHLTACPPVLGSQGLKPLATLAAFFRAMVASPAPHTPRPQRRAVPGRFDSRCPRSARTFQDAA